jgi:hypothetical protein
MSRVVLIICIVNFDKGVLTRKTSLINALVMGDLDGGDTIGYDTDKACKMAYALAFHGINPKEFFPIVPPAN